MTRNEAGSGLAPSSAVPASKAPGFLSFARLSASAFEMYSTDLTPAVASSSRFSSDCWAWVAESFTYTSATTRLRTALAVPVVAWTIGMNTPSTSAVSSTVSSAARAGAELRRSPRSASRRKKAARIG